MARRFHSQREIHQLLVGEPASCLLVHLVGRRVSEIAVTASIHASAAHSRSEKNGVSRYAESA